MFDERLGEKISEDIISQCHQCGKPCDTHVNCVNDACHLLLFNVMIANKNLKAAAGRNAMILSICLRRAAKRAS
ncbi:MAG: hypothetical protein WDN26_13405 [Chitinophagaceae bacterium]